MNVLNYVCNLISCCYFCVNDFILYKDSAMENISHCRKQFTVVTMIGHSYIIVILNMHYAIFCRITTNKLFHSTDKLT